MCIRDSYSVVWFKRDLRIEDHLPLLQALQRGPVLCLYIVCLLYTSDAADERSSVDLGGRRIIKKKKRYSEQTRSVHI